MNSQNLFARDCVRHMKLQSIYIMFSIVYFYNFRPFVPNKAHFKFVCLLSIISNEQEIRAQVERR